MNTQYFMRMIWNFFIVICAVLSLPIHTWSQTVADGYSIEQITPVGDLLSGITSYHDDILVCEYDRGRILRVTRDGEISVLIDELETPVDVEVVDDSVWVLQQHPGDLIEINLRTKERRTIVSDLFEPTAFALSQNNEVYIVEFLTGQLIEVDLQSGELSVLKEFLDNPADVAVLPSGEIYIAEQVGLDYTEGGVLGLPEDSSASQRESGVVDASGIAVRDDGSIIVTSFYIDECGSGGVILIGADNQQRTLVCDMTGPTGLTILPDGSIAVMDEVTNSIVLLSPDGSSREIIQGNPPILDFDIFPNGEIVTLNQDSTITFFYSNQTISQNTERLVASVSTPEIEVGGDGNLYVFNPLFLESYVYNSDGELLLTIETPYEVSKIIADPTGGIAMIIQRNTAQLLHIDRSGIWLTQPVSGDANSVFLYPNGETGSINVIETDSSFAAQTGYLIAVDNDNKVWYAQKNGYELYVLDGLSTTLVAQLKDQIVNIEINGSSGVMVGTSLGNLMQINTVYDVETDEDAALPSTPPTQPDTAVDDWFMFD